MYVVRCFGCDKSALSALTMSGLLLIGNEKLMMVISAGNGMMVLTMLNRLDEVVSRLDRADRG